MKPVKELLNQIMNDEEIMICVIAREQLDANYPRKSIEICGPSHLIDELYESLEFYGDLDLGD